ncbi:MAG TPA: hypothetical protein VFR51_10995, partial [Pyrinomonadaceae bacterium]|nr:hypothetical protein [Pyrinomonadaceae bacterium]
ADSLKFGRLPPKRVRKTPKMNSLFIERCARGPGDRIPLRFPGLFFTHKKRTEAAHKKHKVLSSAALMYNPTK